MYLVLSEYLLLFCNTFVNVTTVLYFQVVKICKWVMGRTDGVSVLPFLWQVPLKDGYVLFFFSFWEKPIKILSRLFSKGDLWFAIFHFQIFQLWTGWFHWISFIWPPLKTSTSVLTCSLLVFCCCVCYIFVFVWPHPPTCVYSI